MTGDPATPAPAPGFKPADSLNEELLWTLHSPDSWARAIATGLVHLAEGRPKLETGAIVRMEEWHGGRLRVRLRFYGEGGGEFGEEFKLTI